MNLRTKIKYDQSLMAFMSIFEKITRASVKDCLETDTHVVFIVQPGQMGKAIGKRATNIKKLENALKKKIRIVEFNPLKIEFIKNLLYPRKYTDIEEKEGIIIIKGDNIEEKSIIIGKKAQNLREMEIICKRYFDDIKEIKVV